MPRRCRRRSWVTCSASSGRHQIALALLAAGVFGADQRAARAAAPHRQRRHQERRLRDDLLAGVAYAGVALLEQALKLALNVYRGWVSEDAVRSLRRTLREDVAAACEIRSRRPTGTHAAMVVAEAEPIGGFVGMAISEPLLQVGILVSVIGYMVYLEPWALAAERWPSCCPRWCSCRCCSGPSTAGPSERIRVASAGVSGDIVESRACRPDGASSACSRSTWASTSSSTRMNLLMNLMHHVAVAVALGVGGWLAIEGHASRSARWWRSCRASASSTTRGATW